VLTPTPMLRPSPLDISGLFSGTFQALKQRFGLFLLIALLPVIASAVLVGAGVAIAISAGVVAYASNFRGGAVPIGILVGAGVMVVGVIATVLIQLKSQAMMAVAAYEIAQGARPDLPGLFQRTRGFLVRLTPVIFIAVGALAVIYGAMIALGVGSAVTASRGGRSGGAAALGLIGAIFLFVIVLVPVSIYVQTKLLYTIPAVAIEQLGGVEGMKRSWRLTKGEFWRTFGYYLLASLAVGAISYLVSLLGQMTTLPMMSRFDGSASSSQMMGQLAALVPVYLLIFGLQMVVQLITGPFLHAYVTYMFVDQVRRSEMPANPYGSPSPGYGYGYQPGTQAQPGPYGAQPPQGYGQPGQGYGQGQGYPAPAQYPPPQPPQPPQGQWPPAGQAPPDPH